MLRRLFASFVFALPLPAAADLGINVYGFSYHFDRGRARDLGLDNEVNPGLGVRYRIPHSERRWRVGGALALLHSDTYNRGKAFVAPLPLAAYEFRSATLNFVYLPEVSDLNGVATLGVWATVWLR